MAASTTRTGGCADGERIRPLMTRVLVVEDEESFSDALSYMLRREGYEVAVAGSGLDALAMFDRNGADLVLLDLMLPGLSGTEVCRALRQRSRVPIIIVTARDSEVDKVVGLELGADDYVTKPFSSRELVARIRAVLRRGVDADDLVGSIVEAGPVRMDVERHTVSVDGRAVSLPLKEFDLLELLLRNAEQVISYDVIRERVWGYGEAPASNALQVFVGFLRRKLEDGGGPRLLHNVRGVGYVIRTAP